MVPLEGCRFLGSSKGAFANVMAWAESQTEFRARVDRALADIGLALVELEDCELFTERHARSEVGAALLTMENTLRTQPDDVVFGTFHKWTQTDA